MSGTNPPLRSAPSARGWAERAKGESRRTNHLRCSTAKPWGKTCPRLRQGESPREKHGGSFPGRCRASLAPQRVPTQPPCSWGRVSHPPSEPKIPQRFGGPCSPSSVQPEQVNPRLPISLQSRDATGYRRAPHPPSALEGAGVRRGRAGAREVQDLPGKDQGASGPGERGQQGKPAGAWGGHKGLESHSLGTVPARAETPRTAPRSRVPPCPASQTRDKGGRIAEPWGNRASRSPQLQR